MESFITNLKYALRIFSKRKVFSLVVIVTLGIGIGTSSAIFSFVNSVLLKPLPFRDPEQLVIIESIKGGEKGRISQREIADMLENTTVFEEVAGYIPEAQYNLTDRGEPEEIPSNICSGNLFSVLGVEFLKGSTWPKEFDMKRSFGIVLTEELWKRKFGADNNIVNETITLDNYTGYTVFGVLPSGFDFPKGMQMFRSATIRDVQVNDRNSRAMIGIGRLRGDATIEEAQQQLDLLGKKLSDQYPETNGALSFALMPLRDMYIGPIKPYLFLVVIAVIVVLIIACVNVSNLLLSAGAERDKEVAVRTVMGARRQSLIYQFLTESILMSLTGGILGVVLSAVLLSVFKDNLSKDLPRWISVEMNTPVLLFSFIVAVVSGLVAGLLPALKIAKTNLSKLIKESRGSSGGVHRHRLRKSLVVAELTLSIILLVGTLFLLKSFDSLKRTELGFNPDNVLTYQIALPWRKYTSKQQMIPFYRSLMIELKKIPGVKEVAFNDNLPLSYDKTNTDRDSEFTIQGQGFAEQKSNPYVKYQIVSPSYREMLEIPLLQGRWITEFDDTLTTPIAVINHSMAKKVFNDGNPIGKQIKFGKPDGPAVYRTIVGVVGDVRHDDMRKSEGNHVYLSRWQMSGGNQFVLLKTDGPPMQFVQAANKAVWLVDGDQSTFDMKSMKQRIDEKLWQDNVIAQIFSLFAIISVILASIGIYSVMSYAISLRTKEFGVRRVLGASTRGIVSIVFSEVVILVAISLVIGMFVSVILVNNLSTILYNVDQWNLVIYITVGIATFLIAVCASLFPAWRATLINPVDALKNE